MAAALAFNSLNDHTKGLLITFVGAMVITFDTPVLRLIDGPTWTVMFWRSVLLSIAVTCFWLVMKLFKKPTAPLINGKSGFAIIVAYSIGGVSFILSVHNTEIANVVFILALTPLAAALISLVWFKEVPTISTWLAMAGGLIGVGVIVWGGIGTGSMFGNAMAAITTACMALAFTITRYTRKDMSMSPMFTGIITASIAYIFVQDLSLTNEQWFWMGINGVLIMPLAYSMLALGPKYISAAEVALFLLLETVLAPIWVWFAVGEKINGATIIGGAIILATLITHSTFKLMKRKRVR